MSELNEKEMRVVSELERAGQEGRSLAELAAACFGAKGVSSGEKGNSWARNSVRKPLRLGLIKKLCSGRYALSSSASGSEVVAVRNAQPPQYNPPPMNDARLPPKTRRTILETLTRDRLASLTSHFQLDVDDRRAAASHVNTILRQRRLNFGEILEQLTREELKAACTSLGMESTGREKEALIARISNSHPDEEPARAERDEHSAEDATDTTNSGVEGDDDDESGSPIEHPYDPSKTHIITKPLSLDLLRRRLENDEIDLQPDFQRGAGLWKPDRMSRLIESLLIRIPLPVFYFDATNDERWLVVDGLQRLSTLKRFLIDKDLRLTNLEYLQAQEGRNFDELPRDLQRRIEETQVTVHLIQPGTPPEVKYNIFRRINTGGLVLTAQEIRHALNKGPATDFLARLASLPEFRAATDGAIRPDRMLDREFVLRFAAFVDTPYHEYRDRNLDIFLTNEMATLNRASARHLHELHAAFKQAMSAASAIFGRNAFRKRSRRGTRSLVNKALFEAWSVALGRLNRAQLAQVLERRGEIYAEAERALAEDGEFENAISVGTGDVRKVRKRFETVQAILERTVER